MYAIIYEVVAIYRKIQFFKCTIKYIFLSSIVLQLVKVASEITKYEL